MKQQNENFDEKLNRNFDEKLKKHLKLFVHEFKGDGKKNLKEALEEFLKYEEKCKSVKLEEINELYENVFPGVLLEYRKYLIRNEERYGLKKRYILNMYKNYKIISLYYFLEAFNSFEEYENRDKNCNKNLDEFLDKNFSFLSLEEKEVFKRVITKKSFFFNYLSFYLEYAEFLTKKEIEYFFKEIKMLNTKISYSNLNDLLFLEDKIYPVLKFNFKSYGEDRKLEEYLESLEFLKGELDDEEYLSLIKIVQEGYSKFKERN